MQSARGGRALVHPGRDDGAALRPTFLRRRAVRPARPPRRSRASVKPGSSSTGGTPVTRVGTRAEGASFVAAGGARHSSPTCWSATFGGPRRPARASTKCPARPGRSAEAPVGSASAGARPGAKDVDEIADDGRRGDAVRSPSDSGRRVGATVRHLSVSPQPTDDRGQSGRHGGAPSGRVFRGRFTSLSGCPVERPVCLPVLAGTRPRLHRRTASPTVASWGVCEPPSPGGGTTPTGPVDAVGRPGSAARSSSHSLSPGFASIMATAGTAIVPTVKEPVRARGHGCLRPSAERRSGGPDRCTTVTGASTIRPGTEAAVESVIRRPASHGASKAVRSRSRARREVRGRRCPRAR